VGKIGVHLDDDVGPGGQNPAKAENIGRPQAEFAGPVNYPQPAAKGPGQLLSDLTGAVRGIVIDNQDLNPTGQGQFEKGRAQLRQVLGLVVGWDYDRYCRHGTGLNFKRKARLRVGWIACRLLVEADRQLVFVLPENPDPEPKLPGCSPQPHAHCRQLFVRLQLEYFRLALPVQFGQVPEGLLKTLNLLTDPTAGATDFVKGDYSNPSHRHLPPLFYAFILT
jgi:hypothetical protein